MEIKEKIKALKEEQDAVILAHYYVSDEVQALADYIGDSFYLSKLAVNLDAQTLVVCGVSFTVSYTHLDVYKRQPTTCAPSPGIIWAACRRPWQKPRRLWPCPPPISGCKTMCSASPVSYTHLDVYKRQLPAACAFRCAR